MCLLSQIFFKTSVSLVLAVSLATLGCSDTQSAEMMSADFVQAEVLRVNPPGPMQVGFSDVIEFEIVLADEMGTPIADAPVDVAFIDQPHNASVAPAQLVTDASGRGTVVFTSPSPIQGSSIFFEIRFRSAETESFVEITVDPDLVAVTFEVDYEGKRSLHELDAVLYKTDVDADMRTQVDSAFQDALFPAVFTFAGLLRDGIYEIEVNGRNSSNEIRATGNLLELVPNTEALVLQLEDTMLNLIGKYDASWEISTAGSLDWAVDSLVNAADFVQNTAGAVLDGIETELSTDPFAKETFIAQRAENNLDTVLAEHFQSQGVDVPAEFESIGQAAKASLSVLLAEATFEIGKDDAGETIAYHAMNRLTFGLQNDQVGPLFLVSAPESATCDVAYGPDDTLELFAHDVALGLGNPIALLLGDVITETFGSSDLARALQSLVDCTEVALFLEPLLSDVAVRSTIELGCLSSIETAQEAVDAAVTTLNQTNRISFSDGTCALDIPLSGNQVAGFKGEKFSVSWHEVDLTAAPMPATINALGVVTQ